MIPMTEMDYDDIDMLTPSNPAQFYASIAAVVNVRPNLEIQSLRRSTRPRRSLNIEITKTESRKRTLSTSALQNSTSANTKKKIRLDEKKAVRIVQR